MKIETKYNIGDKVWFVGSGKAIKGLIRSIHYHNILCMGETESYISYDIDCNVKLNRSIDECDLFPTKEELLNSL